MRIPQLVAMSLLVLILAFRTFASAADTVGDTIRVFPAVPQACPDVVFHNLRAEGAFLGQRHAQGWKDATGPHSEPPRRTVSREDGPCRAGPKPLGRRCDNFFRSPYGETIEPKCRCRCHLRLWMASLVNLRTWRNFACR